ncbi:hypothetical protein HMPREF0262_00315 [Clostridium sp. ATCC 29733]|nr:hypothetical protein HMPREF0262_00315 [Clostridium sp. ATCC 29733]
MSIFSRPFSQAICPAARKKGAAGGRMPNSGRPFVRACGECAPAGSPEGGL